MEQDALDDFLGELEDQETEVENEAKAEDDTKETTGKTDPDAGDDPKPDDSPKQVPLAALLDERRKYQQARQELEELRSQIQPVEEEPDPLDDPEAWKQWQRDKIKREENEAREREITEKIEESRTKALETHQDFEQMEKTFAYMAAQDQTLSNTLLKQDDPAEWAYQQAVKYEADRREAIRSELMAEIEAKQQSGQDTQKLEKKVEDLDKPVKMPSLATATAAGPNEVELDQLGDLGDELDMIFRD